MRTAEAGRSFARSRSGAVALVFALSLPVLLGGVGLAVDYAMVSHQQAALQSASDSAALRAAREMIIAEPSPARVQAVAKRTVDSILSESGRIRRPKIDWTVTSVLDDTTKSVIVKVSRPVKPVFAKIYALLGFVPDPWVMETSSKVILSHNSKLCMLLTGENGTVLELRKNARLTGTQCSIHSNSRSASGIRLGEGSELVADLVCSRGGINNQGSTIRTDTLNDCPPVEDPLRARPAPPVGSCIAASRTVLRSGTHTLNPGTYCGGIDARGTAKVFLNPGIYVFLDGDLTVTHDAEIRGRHVGLYFRGAASYFRFRDNALVDLIGPKDGPMAGLLIWRDRANNLSDKAAGRDSSQTNSVNANRAMRLTGTIYLPEGQLFIGAKAPVAQVSDYTVILARKLELLDGPNLVLNTNYADSDVPVPQDLGPIGLRNMRLTN
ncbi:MAG: pilus assembly protein [Methylobacterium sp.]|nr:pilus assembly protein [Methylobacterium sp.]MCA3603962.1 pilus assembly protein [Methylobacterium sp.]MCA3615858.1 pilus assembly protein [Methylobacterium sp.]MCA4910869.1 pilus assembly protein [Methylobacterium sp.]